jgi:holo-ACP synthase / triphosphoribosyl-dephospho-CoA synthase
MNDEILHARENRIKHVESFQQEGYSTILVLKANIPGSNKNIKEAKILINIFKHLIKDYLTVDKESEYQSADGPYAIFGLLKEDQFTIKQWCIDVENQHVLGRFIDIDVFHNTAHSLSRSQLNQPHRKCYLCERSVYECMKTNQHELETLLEYITQNVFHYCCTQISQYIIESMEKELALEYKFGLVTKTSQGSHSDMDYSLMRSTIDVLIPYFLQMFETGYKTENLSTILQSSRHIGVQAEQDMFYHTKGVNCYKGLIFVLGATISSLGYVMQHNLIWNDIFDIIRRLSTTILDDFLVTTNTSGFYAFKNHQILGVRGEVHGGLPSVQSVISQITDVNLLSDTQIREILRQLIVLCDDTVLLHRAKTLAQYQAIKQKFKQLDVFNMNQVETLNQECIDSKLSFGGAADLLVTTIFLKKVERGFF